MADEPDGEEQACTGGDGAVEEAYEEQSCHADPQAPALPVSRLEVHAKLGLEHGVDAQAHGERTQGDGGGPFRHMQDGGGAQHHAGQASPQDDHGEAPLQMAFLHVPQGGADAQGHAGQLVGGQGHAEGQAQEDEHGELDQPRTAAGQGGEPVGDEGGDEQDGLVGQP